MSTRERFVPESRDADTGEETRPVLTVFRSRRTRVCDGCGERIQSGEDYLRLELESFHRECMPEASRR